MAGQQCADAPVRSDTGVRIEASPQEKTTAPGREMNERDVAKMPSDTIYSRIDALSGLQRGDAGDSRARRYGTVLTLMTAGQVVSKKETASAFNAEFW